MCKMASHSNTPIRVVVGGQHGNTRDERADPCGWRGAANGARPGRVRVEAGSRWRWSRLMNVRVRRTGVRATVVVTVAGEPPRAMDQRQLRGRHPTRSCTTSSRPNGPCDWSLRTRCMSAGTFIATAERDVRPGTRAETTEAQSRERLWGSGARHAADMAVGAPRCARRRRVVTEARAHPDPVRSAPVPRTADAAMSSACSRLDAIAPLWRALPVGGELVFEWPNVVPTGGGPATPPSAATGFRPANSARKGEEDEMNRISYHPHVHPAQPWCVFERTSRSRWTSRPSRKLPCSSRETKRSLRPRRDRGRRVRVGVSAPVYES